MIPCEVKQTSLTPDQQQQHLKSMLTHYLSLMMNNDVGEFQSCRLCSRDPAGSVTSSPWTPPNAAEVQLCSVCSRSHLFVTVTLEPGQSPSRHENVHPAQSICSSHHLIWFCRESSSTLQLSHVSDMFGLKPEPETGTVWYCTCQAAESWDDRAGAGGHKTSLMNRITKSSPCHTSELMRSRECDGNKVRKFCFWKSDLLSEPLLMDSLQIVSTVVLIVRHVPDNLRSPLRIKPSVVQCFDLSKVDDAGCCCFQPVLHSHRHTQRSEEEVGHSALHSCQTHILSGSLHTQGYWICIWRRETSFWKWDSVTGKVWVSICFVSVLIVQSEEQETVIII